MVEQKDESLLGARIVIVLVMVLSSCFVFLPFTKRCSHDKNESKSSCKHMFFAVSACFAAGLLMSISVLHILPESNEMYEGVMAKWEAEEEAAEHALELKAGGKVETEAEHDAHEEEGHEEEGNEEEGHDEEGHEEEGHGGHAFPLAFLIFQGGFFFMLFMNLIFH